MQIAIISTPFVAVPPRRYGGTELVVHELVEGLVRRGHRVTLYATRDSSTSAELEALFPHPCWPPDPLQELNHVSWAFQQIAGGGFDLVHAHSAAALACARLAAPIPLVYTLHHVRDEALSAFYGFFDDPHYVAISEDQKSREVPLPRLTVIHHGLSPDHYRWSPVAGDYVCFVGRFSEIKGPHAAIDAAGIARVPIRVAGEVHPPDREFAEREVIPRLHQDHVTFLGSIGMDVKVPLLREARALLVPITWSEPFGLVIIEAMLSGCPVIAFPRGSVPELVEEGVTGFVAESLDHMAALIRPGGAVDAFDREGCRRRAVERFASDRMVAEHEELYRRILNGEPRDHIGVGAGSGAFTSN